MTARKKRKHAPRILLPASCSGCGIVCHIEVSDFTGKNIDDIELETFSFIVCALCTPAVETLEELSAPNGLTVFTSHINPSVVQFSSHTDIIPVSTFISSRNTSILSCNSYQLDDDISRSEAAACSVSEAISNVISIEEGYSVARSWFLSADAVLIIAGAGMSAESGLSTFRYQLSKCSPEHLQSENKSYEYTEAIHPSLARPLGGGLSTAEVCYNSRPEKAWYYDASIRRDSLVYSPHNGYLLLLNALREQHKDFMVLTSNIDHYFIRSNYPPESVYETHGSVNLIQCAKLSKFERCMGVWDWQSLPLYDRSAPFLDDVLLECDTKTTPLCPVCRGATRANISHESDSAEDIDQTVKSVQRRNLWSWLRKFRKHSGPDSSQVMSTSDRPQKIEKVPKKLQRERKLQTYMAVDNSRRKLLVIEIGCGDTVHGLRQESELLLSSHPISGVMHSKLIRINPDLKDNALYSHDNVELSRKDREEYLLEVSNMESQGNQEIPDCRKIQMKDLDDSKLIDAECSWKNSKRILGLSTSALQALQNIFG